MEYRTIHLNYLSMKAPVYNKKIQVTSEIYPDIENTAATQSIRHKRGA